MLGLHVHMYDCRAYLARTEAIDLIRSIETFVSMMPDQKATPMKPTDPYTDAELLDMGRNLPEDGCIQVVFTRMHATLLNWYQRGRVGIGGIEDAVEEQKTAQSDGDGVP